MVRIAIHRIPDDFGIDACAPTRACSSSSSTTTPAPSPNTNPSRSLSNGRLALVGSSFLKERALADANPATPKWRNGRFRASGDHHIRIVSLNKPTRITDTMIACRAGRHRTGIRPLSANSDGHLA